jgi:hypothetical protein
MNVGNGKYLGSCNMPGIKVYVGQRVYRWGGSIPAVRFKPPGEGGLRGLADVLDPPQNLGRSQLMSGMPGWVHGPAHLAYLVRPAL